MTAELKTVALSFLRPNPFRDLEQFPLIQEKLDKLQESIAAEGFWEGVIARPVEKGYEIAFGHHRVYAARQALGEAARVPVVVRELTDDQMLRFMFRENAEEHGWDFYHATTHAVRAAVLAFGAGRVEFPKVDLSQGGAKSNLRVAPSFRKVVRDDADNSKHYTAQSLASFLRRLVKHGSRGEQPDAKILTALDVLELLEEGGLQPKNVAGYGHTTVREILVRAKAEAERVRRATEEARAEAERRRETAARQKADEERRAREREEREKGRKQAEADRIAREAAQKVLDAHHAAEKRRQAEERDAADRAVLEAKRKAIEDTTRRLKTEDVAVRELQEERRAEKKFRPTPLKPHRAVDLEGKAEKLAEHLERVVANVDTFAALAYDPGHPCPVRSLRKVAKQLERLAKSKREITLCIKRRGGK